MASRDSEVRPEAVQAVMDLLLDMDLDALGCITHVTPAEQKAGREAAEQVMLERYREGVRVARLWELLIKRQWDREPTYQELWDELTDEDIEELGRLYDVLPEPLRLLLERHRETGGQR